MFDSLKNIENTALRAITAGLTASALVTMVAGVMIGITAPKSESAHRWGVLASLLSAVGGTVMGLSIEARRSMPRPRTRSMEWQDWRDFVVVRKVRESQEITSFYLQPRDGGPIPPYQPGQFLTIKLDIPHQSRPVIRTYSLSDYAETPAYYRLSIKRESAPQGLAVPPGVASNFLHDHVEEGKILPAKPPNGKFFLDLSKSSPVILVSNGVGITPMIAMAKAATLKNPDRPVWFLHGARNGDYHAFQQEISNLSQQNPRFHLHYRYSRPRSEEIGLDTTRGYVNIDLIRETIAPELERSGTLGEAEFFLCGSPEFMASIETGLQAWGIEKSRVFSEAFGKGRTTVSPSQAATNGIKQAEIVFSRSMKTLTWTADRGTILAFAEANGIDPPYSCRAGICLTCMCRLQEGEVEYPEPPTGVPDAGSVLICVSRPKTDRIVLDL